MKEDKEVIKDIAFSLCSFYKDDCCRCPDCWARDKAIKLYQRNYRRILCADWSYVNFALDMCDLMCCNCGHVVSDVVYPPSFCSGCGAKMNTTVKFMQKEPWNDNSSVLAFSDIRPCKCGSTPYFSYIRTDDINGNESFVKMRISCRKCKYKVVSANISSAVSIWNLNYSSDCEDVKKGR